MKSNATRKKLLEVTRHMIDEGGVDSVNMRDLGKGMNLSRSAVYRHFKNKEDLLAVIVSENFEVLNQIIAALMLNAKDIRGQIVSILEAFYRYGIQNQEHYQLMFRKQWDKELYPELYLLAFQSFGAIEQHLGQARGQTYKIKKSPKETTALMFAFIHGLVELNAYGHHEEKKGMDDADRLIHSFVDLIFE
ncbi:TetR/AcrR family transcriptional regulator [Paenibacillus sp. YAF4_2]|uniref:TetR/AcrR family transcriptional regulator n=1 Tax=Paenibacillus sp. YAF4_2 TaxID=3233085 RepID=UPI003F976679